jgi:hypothetical protein
MATVPELFFTVQKLGAEMNFNIYHVSFRFEQDCLVVEGIDKTHELVVYSDLTHELITI